MNKRTKIIFAWIVGVAAVFTIIGAVWDIFLNKPQMNQDISDSPNSIITQNQSAGTNIITTAPPTRQVNQETINRLNKFLPADKTKKISICVVSGAEPQQFATEIAQYLYSQGWNVDPGLIAFAGNVPGIAGPTPSGCSIVVGYATE
jgi:hypothetical protein